jgi:hypothetical protein
MRRVRGVRNQDHSPMKLLLVVAVLFSSFSVWGDEASKAGLDQQLAAVVHDWKRFKSAQLASIF